MATTSTAEATAAVESSDEPAEESPLLGRLLKKLPSVFRNKVLPLLDPTALALLRRAGRSCRAAVEAAVELPRAGSGGSRLALRDFAGSDERLAWAKENGCPWDWLSPLLELPAFFEAEVLARLDPVDRTELAQVSRGFRAAVLASDLPSPLLALIQDNPPALFKELVLRLNPTDLALLARAGPELRAAVVASGLPRAGVPGGVPLKICDCVGTVQRLAWAKANGCPWEALNQHESVCSYAAYGGNLEVLQCAREHGGPWNEYTTGYAAQGGHLPVLLWAVDQGCPWDSDVCDGAAMSGNLQIMHWARAHNLHWNTLTSAYAAMGGHLEMLRWMREQEPPCPWNLMTCAWAAERGHLAVLTWAQQQDPPCPWDGRTLQWASNDATLDYVVDNGCPEEIMEIPADIDNPGLWDSW